MKTGGDVKSVVKKAFKLHDEQSHEGKKTNLSKLCNGGQPVKKYAEGKSVVGPDSKLGSGLTEIANAKKAVLSPDSKLGSGLTEIANVAKKKRGGRICK